MNDSDMIGELCPRCKGKNTKVSFAIPTYSYRFWLCLDCEWSWKEGRNHVGTISNFEGKEIQIGPIKTKEADFKNIKKEIREQDTEMFNGLIDGLIEKENLDPGMLLEAINKLTTMYVSAYEKFRSDMLSMLNDKGISISSVEITPVDRDMTNMTVTIKEEQTNIVLPKMERFLDSDARVDKYFESFIRKIIDGKMVYELKLKESEFRPPALDIPCPKCKERIRIYSKERPIKVICEACGTVGILK